MTFWAEILAAMPMVTVLHDSGRFLLTLGVGLFLAYVLVMVVANILSPVRRRLTHGVGHQRRDSHDSDQ